MSAGMAEVIATVLAKHTNYVRNEDAGGVICDECGWSVADKWPAAEPTTARVFQHEGSVVAEELAKAGHGLLPDVAPEYGAQMMTHGGRSGQPIGHGPERNPNWWNKSTHMRLVGPWQELETLPDPLASALADPEGHALVKAIHDRKAEG